MRNKANQGQRAVRDRLFNAVPWEYLGLLFPARSTTAVRLVNWKNMLSLILDSSVGSNLALDSSKGNFRTFAPLGILHLSVFFKVYNCCSSCLYEKLAKKKRKANKAACSRPCNLPWSSMMTWSFSTTAKDRAKETDSPRRTRRAVQRVGRASDAFNDGMCFRERDSFALSVPTWFFNGKWLPGTYFVMRARNTTRAFCDCQKDSQIVTRKDTCMMHQLSVVNLLLK